MTTTTETKFDRLMQWRRGEAPGPWKVSLYPTYRCNIQCRICWKREFPEPLTAKEELPADRLVEMVDEAADLGVREWILGGGGELMLRGQAMMKMVRRIRDHGMNGLIQTNATRFTEAQLEDLVDLQWDCLNVSLDGPTAEINDGNRIENNYARTIETIKRLQAIKKKKSSSYPLVHLVTVVTNINYKHLRGMVDLSAELELPPATLSAVDLIVYGEHDKKYLLSPIQRVELIQHVKETLEYAKSKGVPCGYDLYLQALEQESGTPIAALDLFKRPEDTVSPDTMCFEPFLHMVIMPQGDTGPCCTFNDKTVQNVWNSSMSEVWYGPYLSKVRRNILQGDVPHYCHECMPTQVSINKKMQVDFAAQLPYIQNPSPQNLLKKAAASYRKHGLLVSLKRGKEWLQIHARNESLFTKNGF